jgi:hypothetical protein
MSHAPLSDQPCHITMCRNLRLRTPATSLYSVYSLYSVLLLNLLRSTISHPQSATPTNHPRSPACINHPQLPTSRSPQPRSTTTNPQWSGSSKTARTSTYHRTNFLLGIMPFSQGRTLIPSLLLSISRERFRQMSMCLQGWKIEPSDH